jgi:hypothetical protein
MKLIYNTITETLLPWPRIDDEPVIGLEPHLLEMTVIQEDEPTYDPVTEVLEQTQTIDTEAKTVTRGWNVVDLPPTLYSAEEWLNAQGVGGVRQPTLLYLRQSLAAASKTSPLLNALEQYLQTILGLYAADPSPRANWPLPPTTFEAAVTEGVAELSAEEETP